MLTPMNVAGERILIFGDSLSHHSSDGAVETWDVDAGSDRNSSAPGDLLASMLLEQGAQAVRIDANVGRSAHNFWAGTSRHQYHSASDLIASDQEFAPTKVIVMLGTNDADSGAIDQAAMQAIKDAYAAMGAEVWAIGPPVFADPNLNAKADQVYAMMSEVFGNRLIDARPLSSTEGRAGDGVHFRPDAAKLFAQNLAQAVLTAKALKLWLGLVVGLGITGALGLLLWHRSRAPLAGPTIHMVDGKRWGRGHSPAAAGYKQIPCKAGIPDLHCWMSPTKLGDAVLDQRITKKSLREEQKAIHDYGERITQVESAVLKKALRHARKEEREHAAAFKRLL